VRQELAWTFVIQLRFLGSRKRASEKDRELGPGSKFQGDRTVKILVWGLGYVGTVSAACLAQLGHDVIGIEPQLTKVEKINAGQSPIKEPGLSNLIQQVVKRGKLRATTQGEELVGQTDISLICVGTLTGPDGNPQLGSLKTVARDIGSGLQKASQYHVVTLRSTVWPGTCRNVLRQRLEKESGGKACEDFGLTMNPEFLREGSGIEDFNAPPYIIIGEMDKRAGKKVARLYRGIDTPVKHVSLEEAELLKITSNVFHALKIGFANEIGRLCDSLNLDSHKLMDLICSDSKLNVSRAYLKPGFAFGGSCLPKDLRSFLHHARREGVEVPILESILHSNRLQITVVRQKLYEIGARNVGILGLSFKPGTDDLRESPVIPLIQALWQDDMDVLVHDPEVNPKEMLGNNLAYLERHLPQINDILCHRGEDLIHRSDVVVVSQWRIEFKDLLHKVEKPLVVLDLVGVREKLELPKFVRYTGMSW